MKNRTSPMGAHRHSMAAITGAVLLALAGTALAQDATAPAASAASAPEATTLPPVRVKAGAYGEDSRYDWLTLRGFDATPLDVYSPVYGSFPLPDLGAGSTTDSRVRNLGLLVQDQIKFDDRFVLVAGLRRDRARLETTGSPSQDDSATSKNLGAQIFSPKHGKQLEAGVKWAPEQQRFTASGAVYELRETNRVFDGPTPNDLQQQLGEVTVKGFEIEGSTKLPAWDIVAQYTYMDASETSDAPDRAAYLGKQLAGIPRHSASVWAVHKFDHFGLPGVRAGASARYIGGNADELGDNGVPSITVYDLLLAYDRGPWRLAFNVSNLTDRTYIATCLSRGDCWFGPQRRGVLSVAYLA